MMSILELTFIVTCVNIVNNICQHVIVFWGKKMLLYNLNVKNVKTKKKKKVKNVKLKKKTWNIM